MKQVANYDRITMARAKKDGVYLNVRIETPIYKKLQEVCEEAAISGGVQ